MIPNQIGLERADYSAIADTRSTPATGHWRISARFSSRLIAWLMLLYDIFFWLPTVQVPKNCALLHGCQKQMASGIVHLRTIYLIATSKERNLKAVRKLSLLHLANVKSR
jgi:hypothetical protein